MAAIEYYYASLDATQEGPVSEDQMYSLWTSTNPQAVTNETLIWHENMDDDWVPLQDTPLGAAFAEKKKAGAAKPKPPPPPGRKAAGAANSSAAAAQGPPSSDAAPATTRPRLASTGGSAAVTTAPRSRTISSGASASALAPAPAPAPAAPAAALRPRLSSRQDSSSSLVSSRSRAPSGASSSSSSAKATPPVDDAPVVVVIAAAAPPPPPPPRRAVVVASSASRSRNSSSSAGGVKLPDPAVDAALLAAAFEPVAISTTRRRTASSSKAAAAEEEEEPSSSAAAAATSATSSVARQPSLAPPRRSSSSVGSSVPAEANPPLKEPLVTSVPQTHFGPLAPSLKMFGPLPNSGKASVPVTVPAPTPAPAPAPAPVLLPPKRLPSSSSSAAAALVAAPPLPPKPSKPSKPPPSPSANASTSTPDSPASRIAASVAGLDAMTASLSSLGSGSFSGSSLVLEGAGDAPSLAGLNRVSKPGSGGSGSSSYLPGWAVGPSSESLNDIMTSSDARIDNLVGVGRGPTGGYGAAYKKEKSDRDLSNSLGLKQTGAAKALGIGERSSSFDDTHNDPSDPASQDYESTKSSSLHKEVMDKTGIDKGTVKAMRNVTFNESTRTTATNQLSPTLALHTMRGGDNLVDVVYEFSNDGDAAVTVELNFDGSDGVAFLSPTLPSGGWLVRAEVPKHSRVKVAHVVQAQGVRRVAPRLAMSCAVLAAAPSLSTSAKTASAPSNGGSSASGPAERKALSPELTLIKQKLESPIGYAYSFENKSARDVSFTLDFGGSDNLVVNNVDGLSINGLVIIKVIGSGLTVAVCSAVQKGAGSLSIRTKVSVQELSTSTTYAPGKGVGGGAPTTSGGNGMKGPVGATFHVATNAYKAKSAGEMSVLPGDEVFVQGGNAGGGGGFVVGVNARSGETGLVPAELLAAPGTSSGVPTRRASGSFNNVYVKKDGGGIGSVGATSTSAAGADKPKWSSVTTPLEKPPVIPQTVGVGGRQPVGLPGMGRDNPSAVGGLGTRTYVASTESKTFAGIRVDPITGNVVTVKPGETKSWVRPDSVVRGYEGK